MLDRIKQLAGKVVVVVIRGETATDRSAMLTVNTKKINPDIKILTIRGEH
ncbi:MAG: hypothetical protein M3530_02300 [Thermoproteota archaeon]|nr:hypothetical protein [Thermoproteota archaeon]